MYFSPGVLHPAQKEQITTAFRELADILISGVDRQRDLQVEAIREFCDAQESDIWALAKATKSAQLISRGVARSAPASLQMWQICARSGKIEADVRRQVIQLFGRCAAAVTLGPSQKSTSAGILARPREVDDQRDREFKQMGG